MAEINLKTLTPAISEIDVNFNGTLEGQADATIPLNVNLTDGVSDVTPTSVALTGNDLDIVIPTPIIPSGVSFQYITASQYTSYRTGDEGWRVQNGFFDYTPPTNPKTFAELDMTIPNYFFKLKNPLIVNGVSSTTRFVDINGVQVFTSTGNANLALIDKLTGKMILRGDGNVSNNWNNFIDNSLSYSIVINGVTYSDWFLPTLNEMINIFGTFFTPTTPDPITSVNLLFSSGFSFFTATTLPSPTTSAQTFSPTGSGTTYTNAAKTSGTLRATFITDVKHLITAP
jgi:hypothetical protein